MLSRRTGPEEGARSLVEKHLAAARAAVVELEAGEPAAHPLRVALRRLRTVQRHYRTLLDGCGERRLRLQARSLMATAGEARDREVFLIFLEGMAHALEPGAGPGFDWLLETTHRRTVTEYEGIRQAVPPAFLGLANALDGCLSDARRLTPGSFYEIAVDEIHRAVVSLERRVTIWHTQRTDATRHRIRIAGKRVRYLLEPVQEAVEGGATLLGELKVLQELLGGMQDTVVHEATLLTDLETDFSRTGSGDVQRAVRSALQRDVATDAPGKGDVRLDGVLMVAHRIRDRRDALSAELVTRSDEGRLGDLLIALRGVRLAG